MKRQYYLSKLGSLEKALVDTELSACEIESIVGRFKGSHRRFGGLLKGQVWVYPEKVQIRHHFLSSKILWESEYLT